MAGNITIVEAKERFKKVSLEAIRNENIDLFTLGLYTRILVRGKDWNLNINGLASVFGVGASKVRASIKLLEKEGYVRREAVRDPNTGRMDGWNYFIYAESVPENERTALSIYRNTVAPKYGENRNTVKREDNTIRKETTNRKESTIRKDIYSDSDFLHDLISIGVTEETATAWMVVRHKAKAVSTRLAFDGIAREIAAAVQDGHTADECIRTAVERSWRGFKAEWLRKDTPQPRTPSPQRPKQETLGEMYKRIFRELQEDNTTPNNDTSIDEQ